MPSSVRPLAALLVAPVLAGGALAQDFQSPGRSDYFRRFPTNQFTNQFNPALGFVLDGFLDYRDVDGGPDGGDFELRILEINGSGAIDPSAWGYVALVSEEGEAPEIEEAGIILDQLPGNAELKVGQFFIDFGKLMQLHVEELRTLERPLPLREYLGEELGGLGVQFDYWIPVNDETPVRFSFGAFSSLLGGHHGEEEEGLEPEAETADAKGLDDFSYSARVTGMTDVGDNGVLQMGASGRFVPEFAFAFDALEEAGLSTTTYGFDLTYQHTDPSGQERWLFGGEYVVADGDLAAEVDDPMAPTALTVVDDSASGFYAFADYRWNPRYSAGVQFASAEELEDPTAEVDELDLYVTWAPTELRRLRLGTTFVDGDQDETRVYVQFTNFFGAHVHATKW